MRSPRAIRAVAQTSASVSVGPTTVTWRSPAEGRPVRGSKMWFPRWVVPDVATARFRTLRTASSPAGSAGCSIPTRHDMSRRLDAAYLAELVLDHQLAEEEAHTIARALVDEIPRAAFRL